VWNATQVFAAWRSGRTPGSSRARARGLHDAPLLRTDPRTLAPTPFAAKSYAIADDKLSITYKLRDDLLWSDGQKITSADYKFTWDRMVDEKLNFRYRKLYQDYLSGLTAPE
jgi:ABC-type transport system substrate-binding protein